MYYDFTSYLNREGMDSIAVEYPNDCGKPLPQIMEGFSPIPMWIADMNFPTFPGIVTQLTTRVQHPIYGYFKTQPQYYEGIMWWHKQSFQVEDLKPRHISYENSVLGGLMSSLDALCSRGEQVLVHSPTYVGFTSCMEQAGYRLVLSPLQKDAQNIWRMDLKDMEEKIIKHQIHCLVFCSPHNPCGRIWTKEELRSMLALCEKYDVRIISDEIWSSLLLDSATHTPTATISEWGKQHTISLYAPSKTFNLAGLIGGYSIIYNETLGEKVERIRESSQYNHINLLSMHSLLSAYTPDGFQWSQELCTVLTKNIDYAYHFFTTTVEGIAVSKPEATYLLFIDCTNWLEANGKEFEWLLQQGFMYGVIWKDGRPFHGKNAIRLNLALPYTVLEEALQRLETFVFCASPKKLS